MQNSTKVTIISLFVLFLLIPNPVEGGPDTLDRTKIGVVEGEIYKARIEKFDVSQYNSQPNVIPKPGDIFVTFEILEINAPSGTIKLNLTFTADFFDEDPELSEIEEYSLEEIDDALFVYTDWEYWKMNITKSIELNEFDDQTTVDIIDTSSEFGLKSTYQEEDEWTFDETTTRLQISEYIFDKSTGAIKHVKEVSTYTFQNGTIISYTQEFLIAKSFSEDSLSLPVFEFYFSFVVLALIVLFRKNLHNR